MGLVDLDPRLSEKIKNICSLPDKEISDFYDELDPVTRHWMEQVVKEFRRDGHSISLQKLRSRDFIREPVSAADFLTERYLGKFANGIYPNWIKDICYVEDNFIYEYVLTGGIGIGKSTAAKLLMAFRLQVVSCLRDPAEFYEHLAGDTTVFGIFNITLDKANDIYVGLSSIVKEAPFFKECYQPVGKSGLDFHNKVSVRTGSSELHALGDDLLVLCIDEMNFMRGGSGATSQAHKLYTSTQRRLQSRFMSKGFTPGIVVMMSSRNSVNSWLEKHITQVKEDNSIRIKQGLKPGAYISDYSLWDMKRERYNKDTFRVFVGDRYNPSEIISNEVDTDEYLNMRMSSSGAVSTDELKSRLLTIPVDFYSDFVKDIEGSIRDLAGRATLSISPLIRDKTCILDAFNANSSNVDIFKKNPISISITDSGVSIMDYVDKSKLFRIVRSNFQPRVDPDVPRFVHVDLGITGDSAGLAVGHIQKYNSFSSYRVGANTKSVVLPFIYFDVLLTIIPPSVGEIPIQSLLDFIISLKSVGFNLGLVTYDGFQSRHSVQILKTNNIKSAVFSVDRDDTPYRFLRAALMDRRVSFPKNAILEDELTFLEHNIDKKKVDHPTGKTKDLSDAVSSVCYNATMNPAKSLSGEERDVYLEFFNGLAKDDFSSQQQEGDN